MQSFFIYFKSGITKWIDKWKKNGWKLANGNKVINRKDIEQLEQTMEGIMVQWVSMGAWMYQV